MQFVPSHYQFAVASTYLRPLRNPRKVLAAVLPARLIRHLDEQGWQHNSECCDYVVVTAADARALHQALAKAGIPFDYVGPGLTYAPQGATSWDQNLGEGAAILIALFQLPPEGCCYIS